MSEQEEVTVDLEARLVKKKKKEKKEQEIKIPLYCCGFLQHKPHW